jgi:Protein of unknown function (DUF992)
MRRSIFALLGATALVAGAAFYAQTHAETSAVPPVFGKSSFAIGSLTCSVASDTGFVFGSTRHLDCLFARTDGVAEPYRGAIKRFGADSGFTTKSHVVWLVFASGTVEPGALAGDYGNSAPQAEKSAASDTHVLVDGGNKHISLEPVRVKGAAGLNIAAGVAEVTLQSGT